MSVQYAWLVWSLILLGVWLVIYATLDSREKRRKMLVVSLWTSLLGFTEPIFVPAYWSPPSLFDLALTTGFDIESVIFAFAIGGGASPGYERLLPTAPEALTASRRATNPYRLPRGMPRVTATTDGLFFLRRLSSASCTPSRTSTQCIVRPPLC